MQVQWLSKILCQLNIWYGPTGNPISQAENKPSTSPTKKIKYPTLQPEQPAMVKLPQIGTVPMTLIKPHDFLDWEANDNSGAEHRISAQWIYPASKKG